MSSIRTFLEEHKKEIIILDFNHVFGVKKRDNVTLCAEIGDYFSGLMVSKKICRDNGLKPYEMTLQQFWDIKGHVLVLYKNAKYCRKYDYIWSRGDIEILWPYTANKKIGY